jgi:hypothetical protein
MTCLTACYALDGEYHDSAIFSLMLFTVLNMTYNVGGIRRHPAITHSRAVGFPERRYFSRISSLGSENSALLGAHHGT